ncbi:DUF5071 domain-containing protein [Chitinophaga sedimenti]|uniref:DUF5071 domain-containing protein n=1 Tax=Chitinophaga sedimenti TaxID=2033606 RepID=UPI003557A569
MFKKINEHLPRFVPRDKCDDEAGRLLQQASWEEIRPCAAELLEWLQDTNWPIFSDVANKLGEYANELTPGYWIFSLRMMMSGKPGRYPH